MLSCHDLAHRHASDYLDGQLGWRARLSVRFHLLACDHCRRFIRQFHKIPALLRNKPAATLDPQTRQLAIKLGEIYATQKNSPPQL